MGTDRIGRITLDGSSAITRCAGRAAMPSMITVGPDSALWFTLNQAHAIGRMELGGELTIRPLPTRRRRAGRDRRDARRGLVHRDPRRADRAVADDGTIQELALPDREAKPHAVIAAQADGVWVSLWGSGAIAHVSDDGEIAELPLPAGSEPHGLAIGPDDVLWVALESGSVIRISA